MDIGLLDSPLGQLAFAFMAVIVVMTMVSVFRSDGDTNFFGVLFAFILGVAVIGVVVMHLSPL